MSMCFDANNINREYHALIQYASSYLTGIGMSKYNRVDPAELVSEAFIMCHDDGASLMDGAKKAIRTLAYKELQQKNATVSLNVDLYAGVTVRTKNNSEDVCAQRCCKKCKGVLPVQMFPDRVLPGGVRIYNGNTYCDTCSKDYKKAWHKKNRGSESCNDNYIIYLLMRTGLTKEYLLQHPELIEEKRSKLKEYRSRPKGRANDKEHTKQLRKAWEQKQRETLGDWFVKQTLYDRGYKASDFKKHPELVENKRQEILAARAINAYNINKRKAIQSTTTTIIPFTPNYNIALYK